MNQRTLDSLPESISNIRQLLDKHIIEMIADQPSRSATTSLFEISIKKVVVIEASNNATETDRPIR